MNKLRAKLLGLISEGENSMSNIDQAEMEAKVSLDKWSKKEILGHLIDSGVNNLRRFTEIQFKEKPYTIVAYSQDELVKANDYQNAELGELLDIWKSLNHRIASIFTLQSEDTLAYEIIFGDDKVADLRLLMTDYVDHLSHHLNQIQDSPG